MAPALFPHELIGEEAEVRQSGDSADRGWRGKIVDETKATVVLECRGKRKRLLKRNLIITLRRTGKIITGSSILRRPEERMKQ